MWEGLRGRVTSRPTTGEIDDLAASTGGNQPFVHELLRNRDLPAETTDGARVRLYGNIELTEEVPSALDHGAEGIGLYRTEFLFLDRTDLPKEEEHFIHARGVLKRVAPYPSTFRTFDLGGDKVAPFAALGDEANPALGLRSIRLCLRERKLFKAQLKGLLRASVHGRMRIMFPLISRVGELMYALVLPGRGLDELSMNPTAIPVVKSVLRGSTLQAARKLAEQALALPTAQMIEALVQEQMAKWYPAELLEAAGEMIPDPE